MYADINQNACALNLVRQSVHKELIYTRWKQLPIMVTKESKKDGLIISCKNTELMISNDKDKPIYQLQIGNLKIKQIQTLNRRRKI